MTNAECQKRPEYPGFGIRHLAFGISESLSPGLGEEMLRRIACGTLLCALTALAGACGSSTTAPTPTPTPITETFEGTLNPAGTNVHPIVAALTGGAVTATLTV